MKLFLLAATFAAAAVMPMTEAGRDPPEPFECPDQGVFCGSGEEMLSECGGEMPVVETQEECITECQASGFQFASFSNGSKRGAICQCFTVCSDRIVSDMITTFRLDGSDGPDACFVDECSAAPSFSAAPSSAPSFSPSLSTSPSSMPSLSVAPSSMSMGGKRGFMSMVDPDDIDRTRLSSALGIGGSTQPRLGNNGNNSAAAMTGKKGTLVGMVSGGKKST